ncbi:MAG: hypothetical protein M3Y42_01175 [Actinomycetota bacterium]|nr:hypothetical protein [Actinomycetota bacterium]MDQ2955561.1 hypothetical protein [Actinomycetota bacterium]
MTIYDSIGTEAEASYRREQITRQYHDANSHSHREHHQGRLNRWREARRHHAA